MQMATSAEDLTQRLPENLLAQVLRRLQATSPCSLATSRCVCKAWRHVVDAYQLLADLHLHSLTGLFVDLNGERLPRHFSPAASAVQIAPFDYLDTQHAIEYLAIVQHCNGLLLVAADDEREKAWVLNPATRQWTHLPTPPPMCTPGMEDVDDIDDYMDDHDHYLVFDPTVSFHYEVFLVKYIPFVPFPDMDNLVDSHIQEREWPPSTFVLLVFSSRTNRWEEKPFLREGEAAGTICDMLQVLPSEHRFAAYWGKTLYIHQRGLFMRINLSTSKYKVIKPPKGFRRKDLMGHHFGKSKNGVYCALLNGLRLRIWHLNEKADQINWILKCSINLHLLLADFSWEHSDQPTKVRCANFNEDDRSKATAGGFGLNFDNSNTNGNEDGSKHNYIRYSLLGFHPNEEIILVHTPLNTVTAYNFNCSKIEEFCCLPAEAQNQMCLSFPYTLCLMGEFSSNK